MNTRRFLAATLIGFSGAAALADQTGFMSVFGQRYRVDRLNYYTDVTWPDPLLPGFSLNLAECEGLHYLSNNRLLISSDAMDIFGSIKNVILEIEMLYGAGGPTGLRYVRTVAQQDYLPTPSGWDLDPSGVSVNTGPSGLATGGDILVSDVEDEDGTTGSVRGFDFSSGAQLEWPVGSGCLSVDTGKFCGFSVQGANLNIEDLAYVPTLDRIITVEDDVYQAEWYTTTGVYIPSAQFLIGRALGLNVGEGKGVTFVPDNANYPDSIRRPSGTVVIAYDDQGPAIQAFDVTNGQPLAIEYLTTNSLPSGPSRLPLTSDCTIQLQIEAIATDAVTGRFFVLNQGNGITCNLMFVLTPVCAADLDGDGDTGSADLGILLGAWQTSGAGDLDGDGQTSSSDLGVLLGDWNCTR